MRKFDLPSPDTVAKFTKSIVEPLPEAHLKKFRILRLEAGLTCAGTVRKRNYTKRKPK